MSSRRKPENQQVRFRIAEARHRPGPVSVVTKRRTFDATNFRAIRAQTVAFVTCDDVVLDSGE
jgi:hypothetical protein